MTPEEMAAPPPGPDQWNEWAETDRRARELAPSLMGLSVEEANAVVAEHDGLTLRLLPADGQVIITAEHLIGRISGFVRDGMIVRVNTG